MHIRSVCFQRFFHETIDQNDHVMVRINTPYQQEPPQLFMKNTSMPPIADLSFNGNGILSSPGLPPGKPIKEKSHNYTNRYVHFTIGGTGKVNENCPTQMRKAVLFFNGDVSIGEKKYNCSQK